MFYHLKQLWKVDLNIFIFFSDKEFEAKLDNVLKNICGCMYTSMYAHMYAATKIIEISNLEIKV